MLITEVVKSYLNTPKESQGITPSSEVEKSNVMVDLTNNDLYPNIGSFFDDAEKTFDMFGSVDMHNIIQQQKNKIMKYRKLAMTPDIVDALDDIVNEIIFSYGDSVPMKIFIDEENDKLVEAITEKFNKIVKLTDMKRNLFQIVKQSYIDGQLIFHCEYDTKKLKNGMTSIKMIEPCLFYFDTKEQVFKYVKDEQYNFSDEGKNNRTYSIEEIVREDFGMYDGKIALSYLEYAIKPANMLSTLEDLLIPLRFSRSISRRVFNVDIGDLPIKRGAEVMNEHQRKFKYKKFYNKETGEVSNQQHITSMVEDYWFANRNGGKGTTVDVLDETGNLGELNDILYLSRKLYKAMKIPNSRIQTDPDADHEFDYESTRVSKDDMKFFMFISRVRQVYSSAFKELLKREVVVSGIMTNDEWNDKEDKISISFANENKFIEKMELDNFTAKLDIYGQSQEHIGKLFTVKKLLKTVFKMSEDEIKEEFKAIQKEEKDKLFSKYYSNDDEGKW